MADDEVDDYMTMTFGDDAAKPKESSLQRRLRLQRERRERGRPQSKAELARAAEAERAAALNRSLFDRVGGGGGSNSSGSTTISSKNPARPDAPPSARPGPASKGLAMMARMGFVVGQPLGKRRDECAAAAGGAEGGAAVAAAGPAVDERLTEPIPLQVKRGRAGLGADDDDGDGAVPDAKRVKGSSAGAAAPTPAVEFDPLAYRDRIGQEREAARLERQVHAAQVVARRMAAAAAGTEEDDDDAGDADLRTVNVLWRGLVRDRRAAERERRLRHQSRQLLDARLRGAGIDADEEDDDDRLARGTGPARSFLDGGLNTEIRDEDEEDDKDDKDAADGDDELAAFEALPARDRLQQLVDWMRTNHRYCFWCKAAYPDDALDGCPGPTEADHD